MLHHRKDTARRAHRLAALIVVALLAVPAGARAASDRPHPPVGWLPASGQVIPSAGPGGTATNRTTPYRNDWTGNPLTLAGIGLAAILVAQLAGNKQKARRSPSHN
jgi:hypothetical protein